MAYNGKKREVLQSTMLYRKRETNEGGDILHEYLGATLGISVWRDVVALHTVLLTIRAIGRKTGEEIMCIGNTALS